MDVTSPVKVVGGSGRNGENSSSSQGSQAFKEKALSPVGGSICSPGSCRCTLCVSQCSAKGGNLSLDGSPISSCSCNSDTCSDTSAETSISSFQDSEDTDASCLSDKKKSLDVNTKSFFAEDANWKSGKSTKNHSSYSPKGHYQATVGQALNQECKNRKGFTEPEINLQIVKDNDQQAVDLRVLCAWSLCDGEPGALSCCKVSTPDIPQTQEFPVKTNSDAKSQWPGNKQIAEVRPLKTSPGVETIGSVQSRETTNGTLHKASTNDANSDPTLQADNKRDNENQPTSVNTSSVEYHGVSVSYGSKSTVVRSESYTGDVQEIVDNVLRANLPVILLAGASQTTAEKVVLYHPNDRISKVTTKSDPTRCAGKPKRQTKRPPTPSVKPVSPKPNTSAINEPQEQAHPQPDCPHQSVLGDQNLISLVRYMVSHLPYCIHQDQRLVLASDVEEVVFADHDGMAGLSTGDAFSRHDCAGESAVVDFCTVDSQDSFANQCQNTKLNEILVVQHWFSTETFLELARNTMKTTSSRSAVNWQNVPLLGEVRFENLSFAMTYHYDEKSKKTMIYVPACDLMAAFPQSSSRLKLLAQCTYPGAGISVAWNMRFRLADLAEARALMRYKASSGHLVPKDGGWRYLTSRSVLVHWHDFRHAFLLKPSLRNDQCDSYHRCSKTVSTDLENHVAASVPTVKVKLCRKSKLEKSRNSPPSQTRGKKRKRSFTKLVRMKKGQNKRAKVKTPSPKMCRTSTPVAAAPCSGNSKNAVKTDDERKASGFVPFSRKNFTYTASPKQKCSPLSSSSSMNETEEQVCRGLWKLQQEVLKLQKEKKRSNKCKENKIILKIKNGNDAHKQNSSSEEEQRMKEQLEHVVNSNPFTQSVESLKMVKQLNKAMESGHCIDSDTRGDQKDITSCRAEQKGPVDTKPAFVKEPGSSKTIPVPTCSEQSPALEKIKSYLKNPLQTVRNPMYLDSSDGNSLGQASIGSHALSVASDDSIVHFLTRKKGKKSHKKSTAQHQSTEFDKLSKQMRVPKKTTPGIFEKKTAVTHKTPKGWKAQDTTPNQYANNPIAEAQRRILEIIRKQHREKAGATQVKVELSSPVQHVVSQKKDGEIAETLELTQQENINKPPEFTYRLFPRDAESGPSKSGLVVVQTEDPTSLPYVMNNGYPYVPVSCIRPLFPLCHCNLPFAVLRKSQCLGRCINMCSFEEAQTLYWEGRHLKMPRITSGDRVVRIDQVAAHLSGLRTEVEDAHHHQPNKKGCYGLQAPV